MVTIPMHTLVIGTISSTGAMLLSSASEPMGTEGLPALSNSSGDHDCWLSSLAPLNTLSPMSTPAPYLLPALATLTQSRCSFSS